MHVAAIEFDLHIPSSRSLKAKRSVVRPIVEGARRRYGLSVAEVAHHGQWQRAGIGMAAVGSSPERVCAILDEVERFVWSRPDVEVISAHRSWIDDEA
ncbi:MAG: DUF503 domain-containing protein [Acidimicrobiales bacterium]